MKSKIAFVWQGVSDPKIFEHWNDGLRAAMQILEQKYNVSYHEPWDEFDADVVLYWEAPCTVNGQNAHHYMNIMGKAIPKILLFAGGPLKKEWVRGFDLLCVESAINMRECEQLGIPAMTAFGINENIFFPQDIPKVYDAIHPATCASWKRQDLFARALKSRGLVVGREQETDSMPFQVCREQGTIVMGEQPYKEVAKLVNQSRVMVQTSEFWGGGQRATLEAMACGIPVICMKDSPKNSEYVEESGFGAVVEPNEDAIIDAVNFYISNMPDKTVGVEYVASKWTSKHYASSLIEAINQVCNIQS